MHEIKNKSGFTLIELSLSLVFIGILSLTIAYIINNTIASYRRGITLNQINTTGIGLVDDMRAAIQGSSTKSVVNDCIIIYGDVGEGKNREECEKNGARNFVFMIKNGNVAFRNGEQMQNVPLFGAFCTGTYSYLWNSGYFFNNENVDVNGIGLQALKIKYNFKKIEDATGADKTESDFRLLKIRDESRAVCTSVAGKNYSGTLTNNMIDITGTSETVTEEPIDLLKSDENSTSGGLALYDLYAATPVESTAKNSMLYSVSFVLGTVQGGINVTKSGNFCTVGTKPEDYEIQNFDYCSINKFNFAAQATGG